MNRTRSPEFAQRQRELNTARVIKRTCDKCGKEMMCTQGGLASHKLWCNPAIGIAKFWAKVDKRGPEECWPWLGQVRWDGYGRFVILRKPQWTHRFSWELHNGRKLVKGEHVLHSCNNPPCCNPAHLRAGTHQENMEEAQRHGRWLESLAIAKAVAK